MEILWVFLIAGLTLGPFILSVIALFQAASVRREFNEFREKNSKEGIIPDSPPPIARPVQPSVQKAQPPPPKTQKVRPKLEFVLGGKASAFIGAAILVMGIAFLVGYAIQHSLIGPGTRVLLGLLSGGALVGLGYALERRGGGKYSLLARALTGAGSALFYFVVFAAYGIYHQISAPVAGAGLLASALAVFGLAIVYRSQAVGVLGVLGAFITPLLIGGEMEKGIFPLIYVAVINAPVILLGVRRKWQGLYNVSFVFTVLYFIAWIDWIGAGEFGAGLLFAVIYFLEFAALGLLKLRYEQKTAGRHADIARLLLSSFLLLGASHWIIDQAGWNSWMGAAFLLLALLHFGLAALSQRQLRRFSEEILAFIGGGILFAAMALPAQLNGEWVSLGWAIEGLILTGFAVRVKSRVLLGTAALIGGIGILKPLCYDVHLYNATPTPFLNARFCVGLISCGLFAAQGWLAKRTPIATERWRNNVWWIGILAALVAFSVDAFWTLGFWNESAWLCISLSLLASGASITRLAKSNASLRTLGCLLLGLLPVQIVWFYLFLGSGTSSSHGWTPFFSPVPWVLLTGLGTIIFWIQPTLSEEQSVGPVSGRTYGGALNIASLVAALFVLTLETSRLDTEWAGSIITILWAIWALALTGLGLIRNVASHRFFGLILFGLTTLKVLLIDSSELKGIERITTFIGTGILLLLLSFIYQKAAARFTQKHRPQSDGDK